MKKLRGCTEAATGNPLRQNKYWKLPNGEDQDRCPRIYIKDDPEWWSRVITAFAGYQNGLLPAPGGLDHQPSRFMTIMAIMHHSSNAEIDFERHRRKQMDADIETSQQETVPVHSRKPRNARLT